ncbi:hypothetical protein LUZ60_003397 [Juncus effusus]|nr:hypothetical protein LUZ60_003397 [Juncus effusus]
MDDALNMFNASNNKNSITWSAMISGCAQNGESKKALDLFSQMHFSGIGSNEFTFVGALNACSDETSLLEGKQVHAYFLKQGYQNQVYVKSALLDTYAKCGCINDAQKAFDEMKSKDIVLWTTIISVFVQNGEHEKALTLYLRMKREGIFPNKLTISTVLRACSNLAAFEQGKQLHAHAIKFGCNLGPPIGSALSTMYAKCGNLADCTLVFRKIPEKDIIAWNSIISAFSQNGRGKEALKLFDEMILEGTKPDNITFVNVLSACSHMGLVDKGWKYFHSMVDEYNLTPEIEHYACMVDILSRAGKLKEAKDFIEKIPINHGMCLWRIVLGACRDEKYYNIGVYAVQKRWQDVERVRRVMRERGVGKDPACSWLEMNSKMHVFVKGELRHCEMERIRAELARLSQHIRSDFGEDFEEMIEDFERVASS